MAIHRLRKRYRQLLQTEIANTLADPSLAPEELPDLLERMRNEPLDLEVATQVKHTPWDTWPFFLLFLGLISGEWYLRKKWGLV